MEIKKLPSNMVLKSGASPKSYGWNLRFVPGATEPNEIELRFIHTDPDMAFWTTDWTRPIIFLVGLIPWLLSAVSKRLARWVRSAGFTWRTQSVIRLAKPGICFPLYRLANRDGTWTEWRGLSHGRSNWHAALRLNNSRQITEVAFVDLDGNFIPFTVDKEPVLIDDPEAEARLADVPVY